VQLVGRVGHMIVYAIIGFILAIVFMFEREDMERFYASVSRRTLAGTLLRWFVYLSDALLVTVKFQVVVAACNTALTLPVLLFLHLPHVPALMLITFVSGLVPVVGNFLAGAVLMVLAYQAKGWMGLVVFVVVTAVLHKLEAYYLNPRLAAQHVRLPSFALTVSLVVWEHLLGFVGLFVSFPFLYVAQRIIEEQRRESEDSVG
jgi:predicted PurR-regulated permease PerM